MTVSNPSGGTNAVGPADLRWPLGRLADELVGVVRGDSGFEVGAVRTLEAAGPGDLAYASEISYLERARASRAGALMVSPALADALGDDPRPLLVVDDPSLTLVGLLRRLHPVAAPPAGIHPTAVVAEDAVVDPTAHLGPYVVVGEGSRLAAGVVVRSHVVIGRSCLLGEGAVLHPHVVLYDRTEVGAGCEIHAGVVLGADGFGYVTRGGEHVKVPQVGRTVLEDGVEVGANSTIDRAVLEATRVGAGSKIDNLVQVGHNVTLGRGCILCGQAGIAGSADLGDYVVLGGQSGAAGHLTVGDGVQVAAKSAVLQSVPPGRKVGGVPAIELSAWRRQALMLPRLGEMARRLRSLEKSLERAAEPKNGEEEP